MCLCPSGAPSSWDPRSACHRRFPIASLAPVDGNAEPRADARGPRLTQDTSVRPWSMMPKGHWFLGGKDGAYVHADIRI